RHTQTEEKRIDPYECSPLELLAGIALVITNSPMTQASMQGVQSFTFTVQKVLHQHFMCYVKPDMTFEDVYLHMNDVIKQHGFINLDFSGNLGHTIEFNKGNRQYFELGNKSKLSDANLFTFEPHIRRKNGEYGFKREDIYFFDHGKLCVL
ncbi:MAG: M24 family metallopeptidase, partial [Alicyclobacillaceae bacterium]|nr:M24 family metallopeptidase [Alicyclobacillaceae bacterium]